MAKIKAYQFLDGCAYINNDKIIAAIGSKPWVRQAFVVVGAVSKKNAIDVLRSVGIDGGAREGHLSVTSNPLVAKLQEDGLVRGCSVLVTQIANRSGKGIVSLTPSEDKSDPYIDRVFVSA